MKEILEVFSINFFRFSWEILKILPPILLLMSLFDRWVSLEWIESHLGKSSGFRGTIFSLLLGTTAAGPLFTAFPVALSLKNKGASTSNIVIFLSSWSTIKLPLLILEISYLGLEFTLWRLIMTLPLIILMGFLMERLITE